MTKVKPEITYDDFTALDIRVGTVCAAEEFSEARKPALKLQIDFGDEIGVKKHQPRLPRIIPLRI